MTWCPFIAVAMGHLSLAWRRAVLRVRLCWWTWRLNRVLQRQRRLALQVNGLERTLRHLRRTARHVARLLMRLHTTARSLR